MDVFRILKMFSSLEHLGRTSKSPVPSAPTKQDTEPAPQQLSEFRSPAQLAPITREWHGLSVSPLELLELQNQEAAERNRPNY